MKYILTFPKKIYSTKASVYDNKAQLKPHFRFPLKT